MTTGQGKTLEEAMHDAMRIRRSEGNYQPAKMVTHHIEQGKYLDIRYTVILKDV